MSRFKTELCNNLIELGICKYGDRCHYAHGAHELRQVSRRHPKYRTERCKNYELTGKCPFGPRCSYVHPKPDYELMIEQLSNYVQHTKAPKPDSEDEDDTISLLTRTATSTSLNSHCGSSIGDSNRFLTGDEANKENHFIIQNPIGSSLSLNQKEFEHDFDFDKENQRLTLIDYPITLNQRDNSVLQPLTLKNPNVEQLTPKAIRPIQPRVAMRAISKNQSQQDSQHSNLQSSSPFSHASSNPFGISNPLSDYFNSANHTTGNHLVSNKQFYTRF